MKTTALIPTLLAIVCCLLLGQEARAQAITGYTSIDYDGSTNTVDAYAETDLDSDLVGDYSAKVSLTVVDQSSNLIASGSMVDTSYQGYAYVELLFSGAPDSTYTAVGAHKAVANLWGYDGCYYRSCILYWDNFNFTSFESQGIYQPWYYYFLSPGFQQFGRRSPVIAMGTTYDSASVTTSSIPRIDSISPDRAPIGQPVDVIIRGRGFGNNPTVTAGSGITVSSVNQVSSTRINARFNISINDNGGNHGVFVQTSRGTSNPGGNFFVQIPFAFTALSVSQANLGCAAGTNGFGAQVLYQVVDSRGVAITQSGMTPEEIVTSVAGGFSDYRPFATPRSSDGFGRFVDIPIGTCSDAQFNFCMDVRQQFRITTPGGQIYFLGTQANRRDCRDGIRVVVTTGPNSQTFTLGTVN